MSAASAAAEEVCTILGAGDAEIRLAGERIRAGKLVAFPTETVYGLGANALDNEAAKKVYAVKGRPGTDPLIVHVTAADDATLAKLWDVSDATLAVAKCLFAKFAPGPLTLVAKASSIVAPLVTGGSGMVGLRVPAHPVARALIDAAQVPIAAPSANTFGHVSPTIAEHVYFDLAPRDNTLTILDGGRAAVGVESTVARIVDAEEEKNANASASASSGSSSSRTVRKQEIEVLRRGAVSHQDILAALTAAGFGEDRVKVTVKDTRKKAAENSGAMPMASPGQLLTHYSPFVPAFLVDVATSFNSNVNNSNSDNTSADGKETCVAVRGMRTTQGDLVPFSELIVIDWGDTIAKRLAAAPFNITSTSALRAYKSLSPSFRSDEACREVFSMLRWTENIEGAKAVVLPLVMTMLQQQQEKQFSASEVSLLEAVEDRLFRAASGRVARFVA